MELIKSAIIGSGIKCDLTVADPWASFKHCVIKQWSNGSFTVEDLGSTNGTYIRNLAMFGEATKVEKPTVLISGDEIQVGRTWIPWKRM